MTIRKTKSLKKKYLHIMDAAKSRTAFMGGSHSGKKGCKTLLAKVKDMIAFPAGIIIINADQR